MSSLNDYYMKMLEEDPDFDKWLCKVTLNELKPHGEHAKEQENE